jgi:hypothetical protein
MKKELTKKINEFLLMEAGLQRVGNAPGFKFSYLVAQNIKILTAELEVIKAKGAKCDEMVNIEGEIRKLQVKFAKKDKTGEPIVIIEEKGEYTLQRYDIPENQMDAFMEERNALSNTKKYKDAIKKQDSIDEEYQKFIKEESATISLYEIPDSCVPLTFFDREEHVPALKAFVFSCMDIIGSPE